MKEIRKSLFLFIILFFEVNTFGQANAPLPNWDFYMDGSIVASSNVEVKNISKPIIYYSLNDTGTYLLCILRTYYKEKEHSRSNLGWLELYLNEKRVLKCTTRDKPNQNAFNEIVFLLNKDILGTEFKDYIGEKLKITFQDEAFQRTPIVLGYLVVQEK